jgi:hypothetical protein
MSGSQPARPEKGAGWDAVKSIWGNDYDCLDEKAQEDDEMVSSVAAPHAA